MRRPVAAQMLHRHADDLGHLFGRGAQAIADRLAEIGAGVDEIRAVAPEIGIDPAGADAIQRLRPARPLGWRVAVLGRVEGGDAAIRPAMRHGQRTLRIAPIDMEGRALVEHDHEIRAQFALDGDRALR